MKDYAEKELEDQIRLTLGKRSDCLLFRNPVGMHKGLDEQGRTIAFRYGLCPGSSDLIGLGPGGRFVAIEVKRPGGGRVSQAQRLFLALIKKYGGLAGVARSVEEAEAIVDGHI